MGDSNAACFPVHLISPFAVNYGINGDWTNSFISRLRNTNLGANNYHSLANGHAVVLMGMPYNDMSGVTDGATLDAVKVKMTAVLGYFTGPMVLCEIGPTTNGTYNPWIVLFNAWLNATFGEREQTAIVSLAPWRNIDNTPTSGSLRDSVHCSGTMQLELAEACRLALATLG